MSQGFSDAVARFDDAVDDAVSRARRIASEAREQSARFRRETREGAERLKSGELRLAPGEVTDEALRESAARFRGAQGLPVERFGEIPVAQPAGPGPVAPPDDDDDDFSQEQIMTRI